MKCLAALIGMFVAAAQAGTSVPGEAIVVLKKADAWAAAAMSLRLATRLATAERLSDQAYLVETAIEDADASALLRELNDDPLVEAVEPNYIYKVSNDPLAELQWALSPAAKGQTHAREGWLRTRGAKTVRVAVLDTGIDVTHPDLVGQVVAGYNALTDAQTQMDDNGHGTHCAGVIGALQDNDIGVVGLNGKIGLIAVKTHDQEGYGTVSSALRGIAFARRQGAKLVSMSWGGPSRSVALEGAMRDASEILFIAASGNGGVDGLGDNNDVTPSYPASYDLPNLIAVAAHDREGKIAEFSNFGRKGVMLSAPGVDVLSTVPGGYAFMSGTSMATPHVTGTAALMLSLSPVLTPGLVIRALRDSLDRQMPETLSAQPTEGRINIEAALARVLPLE